MRIVELENRGVIRLKGPDARALLQGLITNDIETLTEDQALYAALLTPQGKFMFDMIVVEKDGNLYLDVEKDRKADLLRRLMMYKLRAEVEIEDTPLKVWAAFDGTPDEGISYCDPRHKSLHYRVLAADNPAPGAEPLSLEDYETRRIRHGVPDGSRDIRIEKDFWLETNAEKLNGVSFTKGCYVGQELTARMKHRTSLKKMIVPVEGEAPLETGTAILTDNGKTAGDIRSVAGNRALAYLRLEYAEAPLSANGQQIKVMLPASEVA